MKLLIALCFTVIIQHSFAQSPKITDTTIRHITGSVTNERGEPLPGVSITTSTRKGTLSDAKGSFIIYNAKYSDVLLITFVGYSSQRIPVKNNISFSIILQPAANYLDQVVVQAYGITSQRTATGNIGKVSAAEIAKQPVVNPLQILQGRIPGVSMTNVSGYVSGSPKIEIRGRSTIDPKMVAEPLYIIDGVPMTTLNISPIETIAGGSAVSQGAVQAGIASPAGGQSPFFNINPADIESIEVLKDADATAIYGSRAANGVILVTTKKGKVGRTVTELNLSTGYSKVTAFFPLLNTTQYVALRKAALTNDDLPIDLSTAPDLVAWDTTRYTDWQRYAYGSTGKVVNAQLSLSGGTANTNFRVGTGYTYQQDITAVSGGNKRGSLAVALQHKTPGQKFIFDLSTQYSLSSSDLIFSGGTALLPPNAPAIFNEQGKLNYAGWAPLTTGFAFGTLLQPYKTKTNLLNSNLVITYAVTKGLTARINLGYNNSINEQSHTIPIASLNPDLNPKGSLSIGRTFFHNVITEPQIEYSTILAGGKLSALAGGTYQKNVTNGVLNVGSNYSSDLLLGSINAAPVKSIIENEAEYKYTGAFLRLSYNYHNRYIINLNGRRDGSSRFGEGRQFGNFGSIGAAWILSEEKWLKRSTLISFAKLRASYGVTGSDQIGDYGYLALWNFGSAGGYGDQRPLFPARFADSLLQWEENRKLEIGLQVALWKDRINFLVALYRNRCNNQLVSLPVATQGGFSSVLTNSPANVQNIGQEYSLSVKAIAGKDWQLTTSLNVTINRNKLLSYPNFDQSPYKGHYVIGKPLNIQKYLHFTGIHPATGEYQFDDLNKDGEIYIDLTGNTIDDRIPVILAPEFEGGFSSELNYRQWAVSFLFFFRKQQGFNALVGAEQPGSRTNQPNTVMEYWKKPGDVTGIGKPTTFSTTNTNQYTYFSDARISDASFIRLQNVAIYYAVPFSLLQKLHIDNLRFYVQGENLLLITGYKGSDPEIQQFGSMPRPTVITAGLSVKF